MHIYLSLSPSLSVFFCYLVESYHIVKANHLKSTTTTTTIIIIIIIATTCIVCICVCVCLAGWLVVGWSAFYIYPHDNRSNMMSASS